MVRRKSGSKGDLIIKENSRRYCFNLNLTLLGLNIKQQIVQILNCKKKKKKQRHNIWVQGNP